MMIKMVDNTADDDGSDGYSGQVVDADNFWPWFPPHTFAHRKKKEKKEQ